MKESGGKHSGSNESNWKSNLLEDISIEIDDMSQGKMIVSVLPDVERSDTKSDLLAENHCIVTGQKGEIEGNHSERTGPHHTAILSKDNRMNSDDMKQEDMVEEICSVDITQGKVITGKYTRIEKPDRASILLVNTQAIDEIENYKHTLEEIDTRSFLSGIVGRFSKIFEKLETEVLKVINQLV